MNKIFFKTEPTALIIDGPTSFLVGKVLQSKIDFTKLKAYLRTQTMLRTLHYVTPLAQEDDQKTRSSTLQPLIDWLGYNGWRVRARTVREKGTHMTDLCAAMADEIGKSKHVILMAGDTDLVPMVGVLQANGIRVTLLNTTQTEHTLMSNALRKAADDFIDMAELLDCVDDMFEPESDEDERD